MKIYVLSFEEVYKTTDSQEHKLMDERGEVIQIEHYGKWAIKVRYDLFELWIVDEKYSEVGLLIMMC